MAALLVAGGLELDRVIVHAIEDSTFHAVLKLRPDLDDDELEEDEDMDFIEIDSRPSDAIALAVRTGSSIWMLEEVVAEASIAVDAEADAEDQSAFSRFVDELSPAALVRHLNKRGDKDEPSTDTTSPPTP
jgi:bifunctional DNase/RNase